MHARVHIIVSLLYKNYVKDTECNVIYVWDASYFVSDMMLKSNKISSYYKPYQFCIE